MATGNQDLGVTLSSQGRSGAPSGLSQSSLSQAEPPATNAGGRGHKGRSTHCKRGHALIEGNIRKIGRSPKNRNGRCAICRNRIDAEYRERKKLAALNADQVSA